MWTFKLASWQPRVFVAICAKKKVQLLLDGPLNIGRIGIAMAVRRWLGSPSVVVIVLAVAVCGPDPEALAQQVSSIYLGAPIYAEPNLKTEPILIAGPNSTAEVLAREGSWVRISFENSKGQKQIGYVESTYVRISKVQGAVPTDARPTVPIASTRTSSPPPATVARPTTSEPKAPVVAQPQETDLRPQSTTQASRGRVKNVKIRGYVTEFRSPADFDIEDYRITRDESFSLDFENASPDIVFQLGDIRVGVELEIKGSLNEETGELKANSIKVDLEQFRSIRQTAFVSRAPEGIQLLDGSWAGELRADGQVIRVTNATAVTFKPTRREKKLAELRKRNGAEESEEAAEPLQSLDQVTVGMTMTYEGKRDRETGKILAEKIEFSTNDLEDGEAKLWQSLKVSVKSAQGLKPGELKIDKVGKFKLVPDSEVQAYVSQLGERLIPTQQRALAADDPRKIPFQFFVVQNDAVNAFATPNGIVVVNSGLMELLDNEAQLAAIVGHEIAHSTHEHTWRGQQYRKKTRLGLAIASAVAGAYGLASVADLTNLVNAALVNGHSRSLENQSDRVGLQYMAEAGYDPREAPTVWKLMAKKTGVSATNFFWSTHENAPTRRSYLMNELKNNYRELDYTQLRTNAEEYSRIKAALMAASSKKTKIKVR